ncbi:DNA gyrase/topoisomerase IV A subunit family protein [Perkinsela sp. CCAP 1560/4]|nr:DNA gyrase/topoisomerase IV A subunit family protein [Perkinsela sp. CCAP 1560/4]|eukprot:KNH07359.1 DNA gyrase/topoisomerase IV A subunit family protein [Perkinsela sp. CCAP 1560/4]
MRGNVVKLALTWSSKLLAKTTVEEKYQMLHPVDHILRRPDMYVGSNNAKMQAWWLYDEQKREMQQRKINFNPAFYKIFDEILVNAADNKVRDGDAQTYIRVTVERTTGTITVRNDGKGIPVEIHSVHKMWIPEMIFGNLRTSSNYSTKEALTTGGRYGLGAKLTNVLSRRFTVSTYDTVSKRSFSMTWYNNMHSKSKPTISEPTEKIREGFTEISFTPDYAFLKMKSGLREEHIQIIKRRTLDLAGAMGGVAVYFNAEKFGIHSFQDYAMLFPKVAAPLAICRSENWEIVAAAVPNQKATVSFVNSLYTNQGGTHVELVMSYLIDRLQMAYEKKTGHHIKKGIISSHISLFINCRVNNPIFDSQTKKYLKSDPREYGSTPHLEKLCEEFMTKTCILSYIDEYAPALQETRIAVKHLRGGGPRHLQGIEGFSDAYEAATGGSECTLMLTEGMSAKAFAEVGRSILGRNKYGVYALRGKLMNIRGQHPDLILNNQTCQNIIRILGLRVSAQKAGNTTHLKLSSDYDLSKLRYAKIMVIADPDDDGSHIIGLIGNFLHSLCPQLLTKPGFFNILQTPLIRATIGKKQFSFLSEQAFHEHLEKSKDKLEKVRYYKGLGTNSEAEAKACFKKLQDHLVPFYYSERADSQSIIGFFSHSDHCADYRRNLVNTKPAEFRTTQGTPVTFSYFNKTRLAAYAYATCMRTLPNAWDGLVPLQRKVLWTLMKGNFEGVLKVSQLAGYVMERMNYNHGNLPLVEAIQRMAHDFIGSNTIPLLVADGQFGTRYDNGKDAAASRYIFTKLSEITRLIYLPEDDPHLNLRTIEHAKYEPENFFPIIPMSLANGARGIGVGYKCDVPNHSVHQLIRALLMKLQGRESNEQFIPHWSGYTGKISVTENGSYISEGCLANVNRYTIHVTEIPARMSIRAYAKLLQELKQQEIIKSYKERHIDGYVNFFIDVHPQVIAIANRCRFTLRLFGLIQNATPVYTHMVGGNVVTFRDANHLLEDFYTNRMKFLQAKKEKRLDGMKKRLSVLDAQIRFIRLVQKGNVNFLSSTSLSELIESSGFTTEKEHNGFAHLLQMSLSSFTFDGLQDRINKRTNLAAQYKDVLNTSVTESWIQSLKKLLAELPAEGSRPEVKYSPEPVAEWKLSKLAMENLRDRLRRFTTTGEGTKAHRSLSIQMPSTPV